MTSFDLGDVTYTIEPGRVVSMWPDGKTVAGDFQYRAEDVARGRALGYQGSDREVCEQLHAEHDLAHHVVAQALGWPSSVVLRMAAEGHERFPAGVYATEERLAFLLQRVGNVGLRAVAGGTTEKRRPDPDCPECHGWAVTVTSQGNKPCSRCGTTERDIPWNKAAGSGDGQT